MVLRACFMFAVLTLCAQALRANDEPLSQLTSLVQAGDIAGAIDLLNRIESHPDALTTTGWKDHLKPIIERSDVLDDIRLRVGKLAIRRGTAEIVADLIGTSHALASTSMAKGDAARATAPTLICVEVLDAAADPRWAGWTVGRSQLVGVMVWAATTRPTTNAGARAVNALLRGGSENDIASATQSIILAAPDSQPWHRLLFAKLRPTDLEWLRGTAKTADRPVPAVGAALAHLGDVQSRSVLEAWLTRFEGQLTEGVVKEWIWEIDVQQSPDGLLKYIDSEESIENFGDLLQRREWAMTRTLQRGTTKEAVRDALVSFRKRLDHRYQGGAKGVKGQVRTVLSELKNVAAKLEVFDGKDWSDIPDPIRLGHERE